MLTYSMAQAHSISQQQWSVILSIHSHIKNPGFSQNNLWKSAKWIHLLAGYIWLWLNTATGYASQHIWCLSHARINWEGCTRKGIRHKNGGNGRDGAPISLDGVTVHPDFWSVCLCYLHFAPENPKDGEMYLLVPVHPGCPGQSPESCKMVAHACACMRAYVRVECCLVIQKYSVCRKVQNIKVRTESTFLPNIKSMCCTQSISDLFYTAPKPVWQNFI